MAWSYSGDPTSSALDALRFHIGDTESATPLLSNEEINYVLANNASLNRQLAACFETIGRKLLQRPNFALDKWREDRHEVAKSFLEQAKELRKKSAAQGIYAGGISKTDKETREEDTDRDAPFATLDMDEFEDPIDEALAEDT